MKISVYLKPAKTASGFCCDGGMANVCFRIRDKSVDIKVVSEIVVPASQWDDGILGYKSTARVPKGERAALRKNIADIIERLGSTYSMKADSAWAKGCIEEVLHPRRAYERQHPCLAERLRRFADEHPMTESSKVHVRTLVKRVERYTAFQRDILGEKDFNLFIETITSDQIADFRDYIANEYQLFAEHPDFYRRFEMGRTPRRLSATTITAQVNQLCTCLHWFKKQGLTDNAAFAEYGTKTPVHGDPFFLTIEERNRLYDSDLSEHPGLALVRDIFVFQCYIGCRVGDLYRMTRSNIKDGFVEYVAEKTMRRQAKTIRVPLHEKAACLLDRHTGCERLFPFPDIATYNKGIRRLLRHVGIDRMVTVLDTVTGKEVQKPVCDIATSHTARKTFIGNLYKQVPDPNLIASMSGHAEGSRAFMRYRTIDDDMKRRLVEMIE